MVLPPKPPPISAGMAQVLLSFCAMLPRRWPGAHGADPLNWPWRSSSQVVALPSETLTRQACGSM